MSRPFLLALAAAATASSGFAGEIVGYNSSTYDRFTGGFPAAPVANTSASFTGAGLDLSGLGWRASNNNGITLVTPQHFVTASHTGGYAPGETVRFLSVGGVVRSYQVATNLDGSARQTLLTTTFIDSTGATRTLPSDILVVTLSAAIDAGDGVRSAAVGSGTAPQGTNLLVYGQNPAYGSGTRQLGTNTLDSIERTSFARDLNGDPAGEATRVAVFDYTRGRAGDTALIGNDSGSALLTRQGNTAVLLGTHYGVDGNLADPNSPYLSVSTYLPDYLGQLSLVTAADGQNLTIVPVPEPAGVVAAGAMLLAAARGRRWSRIRPGRAAD